MGMGSNQTVSINLLGTKTEAEQKAKLLAEIGQYVDLANLKTLATAAKKPGINQKIKSYASFL